MAQSTQEDAEVKKVRARIAVAGNRCEELEKLICRIYEDNILGKLPDSRYEVLDKQYAREKAELDADNVPYGTPEQGIMIETPAAATISDLLAEEVDFFSIGTNDLTQYTLAIDRQNQKLEDFYDSHHPAVLAMIRMAAESAHAEGKWIGICGELGADVTLTETFLKMDIDELSVAPGMVLKVRQKIREAE